MCTELIDLRAKITREADIYLESLTTSSGKDRSEIVREILHVYALEKINECIMQHKILQAKGMVRETSGSARE